MPVKLVSTKADERRGATGPDGTGRTPGAPGRAAAGDAKRRP